MGTHTLHSKEYLIRVLTLKSILFKWPGPKSLYNGHLQSFTNFMQMLFEKEGIFFLRVYYAKNSRPTYPAKTHVSYDNNTKENQCLLNHSATGWSIFDTKKLILIIEFLKVRYRLL